MFNLIANCLDPSDIQLLLKLANPIRTLSGINEFDVSFVDKGPSFIIQKFENI